MKDEFERDVRSALILGAYTRYWGIPDERVTSRRGSAVVHVYSFPPQKETPLHRFATVGVSALERDGGGAAGWEFVMILPASLAGASRSEVTSFILDVTAYSLRSDVRIARGNTIPETGPMPRSWQPRAVLMDEPTGEPEELSTFHVGIQHVNLLWLVPIYQDELKLIAEKGLSAFDGFCERAKWSLADPARPSVLSSNSA